MGETEGNKKNMAWKTETKGTNKKPHFMFLSMSLDIGEWNNEQEISNVKFGNKSVHQLYRRGTKETKVEPKT